MAEWQNSVTVGIEKKHGVVFRVGWMRTHNEFFICFVSQMDTSINGAFQVPRPARQRANCCQRPGGEKESTEAQLTNTGGARNPVRQKEKGQKRDRVDSAMHVAVARRREWAGRVDR